MWKKAADGVEMELLLAFFTEELTSQGGQGGEKESVREQEKERLRRLRFFTPFECIRRENSDKQSARVRWTDEGCWHKPLSDCKGFQTIVKADGR